MRVRLLYPGLDLAKLRVRMLPCLLLPFIAAGRGGEQKHSVLPLLCLAERVSHAGLPAPCGISDVLGTVDGCVGSGQAASQPSCSLVSARKKLPLLLGC